MSDLKTPARHKYGRLTPEREAQIRAHLEQLDALAATGAWMQNSSHERWELFDEIEALRLEMVTVFWMTGTDEDDDIDAED